jgi:anti-anti-sigma regulatory factor
VEAEVAKEDPMVAIHAERIADLAVVGCKGRIVTSESVFELRDVVQAQTAARIIALDLSQVRAIGGGGLGMLVFLDRWARQHGIQFKLFSPSRAVVEGLVRNRSILNFEIPSFHEMMGILFRCESEHRLAA